MNRRGFLQALGLAAVAVVAAPVIATTPKPEFEFVMFATRGQLNHKTLDFGNGENIDHNGRYFIKKNEDHDCRYPYHLATA